MSASKRYKIERKVKEHHRKARKNARLHPTSTARDVESPPGEGAERACSPGCLVPVSFGRDRGFGAQS